MIRIEQVEKSFGHLKAIDGLSLALDEDTFCTLVGPSGCGKSTLLRMLNAIITPDAGRIFLRGQDIASLPPDELRRGIGYVIQSVGLFPHWRIKDNILAVPRLNKWPEKRCRDRLDEIVALTELDPAWLTRFPNELSGGQQQRVGVARALAADPDIILMDEPFSALDPPSRATLQEAVKRIQAQTRKTIVFVTHDIDEALKLGDQIVLMNKGRIAQQGTPQEILSQPQNTFVEGFIGGTAPHLRLLDLITVRDRMRADEPAAVAPSINANACLKEALNLMLAQKCERLIVRDDGGTIIGSIGFEDLIGARQ